MPSITPLSVRSLSANEAQACTLIAQRAQQLPVRVFDCDWLVDMVPLEAAAVALPDVWVFQFEWSAGHFELQVPLPAAADLLSAAQLYDAQQPLPDALAALMLEAVFAEVFEAIRPLGRGVPHLFEVQRRAASTPANAHALMLKVSLVGASPVLSLSLYTDSMGLLSLAGAVGRRAPVRQPLRADLPLPLRVQIGRSVLPKRDAAGLAVGDVLLLQNCYLDPHQQLWLAVSPLHGVLVKWDQSQPKLPDAGSTDLANTEQSLPAPLRLLVVQAWSSLMTGQTDAATTAVSADDPLTSLEDLPVQLSFDVGELSLTLSQLRELTPGQVLDCARPLRAAVNVRANGILVAQGDLVSIDERLGVSLQQVYLQAAPREDEE